MAQVSVIVPAYNCEPYVAAAVESVLGQGHDGLELIVVNDGSTDGTMRVLEPYRGQLRVLEQQNAGAAAARNAGLQAAQGEFIAFLDADDWWYPSRLPAQLAAFRQHPTAGLVFTDFRVVDVDGVPYMQNGIREWYSVLRDAAATPWAKVFSAAAPVPVLDTHGTLASATAYSGRVARLLFLGNFINTSSVLVRREALLRAGLFDTSLGTEEDYDYWLRIAYDWEMAYVDAPLVARRRRPGQLTSTDQLERVVRNVLRVIERAATQLDGIVTPTDVRLRLGHMHRNLAVICLRSGRNDEARSHLRLSLDKQPGALLSYMLLLLALCPAGLFARLERLNRRLLRGRRRASNDSSTRKTRPERGSIDDSKGSK